MDGIRVACRRNTPGSSPAEKWATASGDVESFDSIADFEQTDQIALRAGSHPENAIAGLQEPFVQRQLPRHEDATESPERFVEGNARGDATSR